MRAEAGRPERDRREKRQSSLMRLLHNVKIVGHSATRAGVLHS